MCQLHNRHTPPIIGPLEGPAIRITRLPPHGPKPGQSVPAWVARIDRADRRERDAAAWRKRIGPLGNPDRPDLTGPTQCRTVPVWSGPGQPIANKPMNQQQLVEQLDAAMAAADEAKKAEAAARDALLSYMIDRGVGTIKADYGQIQAVSTPVWEYRDGGVTKAAAEVDRAERTAKVARDLLKGCQSAARSAGKAKVIETKVALRVVRGKVDAAA